MKNKIKALINKLLYKFGYLHVSEYPAGNVLQFQKRTVVPITLKYRVRLSRLDLLAYNERGLDDEYVEKMMERKAIVSFMDEIMERKLYKVVAYQNAPGDHQNVEYQLTVYDENMDN